MLKIRLFEIPRGTPNPYESVSNITAVDNFDILQWQAEAPKSHYETYFDLRIDDSRDLLIAITGSGYHHLISLDDGKVIDYYLVK